MAKPNKQKSSYLLHPVENLTCSLIASCVAEASTYPLEVAKVRLQIQGENLKPGQPKLGLGTALIHVAKNEGFSKLFAGLPAGLLRHSIAGTMRLGLYDPCVNMMLYGETEAPRDPKDRQVPALYHRMLASSSTGMVAQILANPADLVKTKLQAEGKLPDGVKPRFTSTGSCFKYIIRKEGIRGLWGGVYVAVPRMAWQNMAEVTAYDLTKHLLREKYDMEDGLPLFFLGSLSAGFFGAYLGNPIDSVKTRIYNNPMGPDGKPLYKGGLDVAVKMFKNEGILSFWKGVVPLWFHVSAFSVAVFVTFDMLRMQVKNFREQDD